MFDGRTFSNIEMLHRLSDC